MLNRFFLLSKTPHLPDLNRQYHAGWNTNHWMEYQQKSNEKYTPFYIVFQVLKVLFIKIFKIQLPDLLFLVLH